jgi:hypothetical protein
MIPEEEQDQYLHKKFDAYREFWQYKREASEAAAQAASQQPNEVHMNGSAAEATPAVEQVTTLVARKKKDKKRVTLDGVPSAAIPEAARAPPPPQQRQVVAPAPVPSHPSARFEEPQNAFGFGEREAGGSNSNSREAQFWARSKSMGNLAFGRPNNGFTGDEFRRGGMFDGGSNNDDPFLGGGGAFGDSPMVDAFHQESSPARPGASASGGAGLGV